MNPRKTIALVVLHELFFVLPHERTRTCKALVNNVTVAYAILTNMQSASGKLCRTFGLSIGPCKLNGTICKYLYLTSSSTSGLPFRLPTTKQQLHSVKLCHHL
ncbi:Uncharacterized protein HZ326_19979 [Fusarium oxysporum f. sp. albedinis]|nr:Uncharacterized protein HZ326_19979 [Fusarium oxysporum f. sp. albedinis]